MTTRKMNVNSFRRRVRLLFGLHFLFILILILWGIILIAVTGTALSYNYWSCPIFNVYYTIDWISLILGILLFILGIAGVIAFACVPRNAIITGFEGRNSTVLTNLPSDIHGGIKMLFYPIEIHQSQSNAVAPITNESDIDNFYVSKKTCSKIGWIRPSAFVLTLIMVGQVVVLILASNFLYQINDPSGDLNVRITNLFVELKAAMLASSKTSIRALECWESVQTSEVCCGYSSYLDWLPAFQPSSPVTANDPYSIDYYKNGSMTIIGLTTYLPPSCLCPSYIVQTSPNLCTFLDENNSSVAWSSSKVKLSVLSQNCSSGLVKRLSGHLYNLRTILPLSITFTLLSFLAALIHTLLMAHLTLKEGQPITEHLNEEQTGETNMNYSQARSESREFPTTDLEESCYDSSETSNSCHELPYLNQNTNNLSIRPAREPQSVSETVAWVSRFLETPPPNYSERITNG